MNGSFICANEIFNARYRHMPAPLFKKVFDWKGDKSKASLEIAVCGIYRVFLNGKELTKGYFAPYLANPDQVVYFDEYFIGKYLNDEKNVLCVLLGNGFQNSIDCGIWDFESASFRSAPKFSLCVYSGKKEVFASDESFLWTNSPILFDDLRCGEIYDANFDMDVLTANTKGYQSAKLAANPKGRLKKTQAESIRAFETIKPIKIFKNDKGYVYDFGVNTAGTFTLNIEAKKGQKIDFYCAEALRDGDILIETISFIDRWDQNYVQQHVCYTCKEGKQSYSPSFTYFGFRYIRVEGLTAEQATHELLQATVLHSDIKKSGSFKTDSEIVNKIQDCVMRSNYSNLFYFPTDCPHREKNGWTDDAALSAEQMCYNLNVYDSLREWLYNIRLSQKGSGVLPGIIPTTGWGYEWGNGPISDAVIVELPYQLYRFGGKKEILEENLPAIEKYIEYAKTKENADGLFAYGIGDWCEAGSYNEGSMSAPVEVCDSLTVLQILSTAIKIYEILGKNDLIKETEKLQEKIKDNFRRKHCAEKGWISGKSQTGQAMGITLGIFGKEEERLAYDNLISLIHESGDVMKAGVAGVKYLFDLLAKKGDVDLALELITTEKWPSYGNLVRLGASTLWEMFQHVDNLEDYKPYDCDGMARSLNHHFWGSVSAWFYRELAGINLIDYNRVEISPKIPEKLLFAEGSVETPAGKISVSWRKEGDKLLLKIDNDGFFGTIKINGYSLQTNESLRKGITEYVCVKQ